MVLELVLTNGERRAVEIPGYTDSVANALDRLDAWIATKDGGWVQKSFVLEVRVLNPDTRRRALSVEEPERVVDAATSLIDARTRR